MTTVQALAANADAERTPPGGAGAPRPWLRLTIPTSRRRTDERNANPEHEFLAQLPLIERVVAAVARKHRLSPTDAEDFASHVKLKFIENRYAILGKYRGESTLRTFLGAVISRQCLDFRTAAWGKWRPSAMARRAGKVATLLERLMTRDDLTFDQACEALWTNHGVRLGRNQLAALSAGLPSRTRRRFASDDVLAQVPSSDRTAEQLAVERQQVEIGRRTESALQRALDALPPTDRLILMMRFRDDQTVAGIARRLCLDQKALYRRITRLLRALRSALEAAGVAAEAVSRLPEDWMPDLGWPCPAPPSRGAQANRAAASVFSMKPHPTAGAGKATAR